MQRRFTFFIDNLNIPFTSVDNFSISNKPSEKNK